MYFMHPDETAEANLPRRQRVARATARTIPRIMGTISAGYRDSGECLHPSQLRTLMMMHGGAVSPSELAEQMEVSLPTISKSLAGLERHGWIERTVDANDRRRVLLGMTEEGRRQMRASFETGISQLELALSPATDEELARIESGLKTLHDVFSRSMPEHHHKGRQCRRPEEGSDKNR